MRDDIYGGLKNALERGESIEQAIQSFVNAGYNAKEVRDAANEIIPEATSEANSNARIENPVPQKSFKPLRPENLVKPVAKPLKTGKLVILISVLLILVAGLIITILLRKPIIEFLTSLF